MVRPCLGHGSAQARRARHDRRPTGPSEFERLRPPKRAILPTFRPRRSGVRVCSAAEARYGCFPIAEKNVYDARHRGGTALFACGGTMPRTTFNLLFASGVIGAVALVAACNPGSGDDNSNDTNVSLSLGSEGIDTLPGDGDGDPGDGDGDDTSGCPPGGCLDLEQNETSGPACAAGDGQCDQVDLL